MRRVLFALLATLTLACPAVAQDDQGAQTDRLNRLERDINFLQKQVYRGATVNGDPNAITTAPVNGGSLDVRLSQMDEEIRRLRGQIEQVQFQNKQTADALKKLSDDADYRLRALEQKQAAVDAAAAASVPVATPETTPPAATPAADTKPPAPAAAAATPAKYQPDGAKPAALTGNDFPNANAHYSYAFKLLNEKKFSEAATSFDAFVKKFPSDPLTSNAYYWLGESYYARADYTRAAESFRKGFEVNAEGQKAPDNLLKLAMSLHQVKRTSEACVVLAQIISKYEETAPRTSQRAHDQRTAMQCK